MGHAPDAAVVTLVSVVVLFSHGLQPRRVDHKQMSMTFLTAAPLGVVGAANELRRAVL